MALWTAVQVITKGKRRYVDHLWQELGKRNFAWMREFLKRQACCWRGAGECLSFPSPPVPSHPP